MEPYRGLAGHAFHGRGMGGAELALEFGGRLWIEVPGIVEERLCEPEHATTEDVQGVMHLCDGKAAFAEGRGRGKS
jgi:hypothetical protein